MRAWVISAFFLIVLSVAPVPASAVACLKCSCPPNAEIICLETKETIQRPGVACNFACGVLGASIQPYDEACATASPDCTPENTRVLPASLISPAPALSPWALSIVAILLSLGGVFTLRRRVRER